MINNNSYSSSGVFIDAVISEYGCNTIVTTNLTVKNIDSLSINATVCSGYPFFVGSNIYYYPGNYVDTLSSFLGCDSIVYLALEIEDYLTLQNINLCEGDTYSIGTSSYISNGIYYDYFASQNLCDSIVETTINVIPSAYERDINLCNGDSIQINDIYESTEGTYPDNYISEQGCDSIIMINLIISENIDFSISYDGTILSSNLSGEFYQWIACNGNPIINENNQSFTPMETGYYGVIVTHENCIDTSECTIIIINGVEETINLNKTNIYPNPSKGSYTIDVKIKSEVTITNILGEVLLNKTFMAGKQMLNLQSEANGIYLVRIYSKDNQEIIKVVKEN